jgi:hypothetical protein
MDGYRFGSANGKILPAVAGSSSDVLQRARYSIEKTKMRRWQDLDERIWVMIWEWMCVCRGVSATRCSIAVLVNRSMHPIQITRIQMVLGCNAVLFGSAATGFDPASKAVMPDGVVVIFLYAFPQSPLEPGHLRANIHAGAFDAVLASTQRETTCDPKAGFVMGFLEKTVTDWWSKYVMVIR